MQKTILKTQSATLKRENMGKMTVDILYEFINRHPNTSVSEIKAKLNWSTGKVHSALRNLEKSHLVKSRIIIKNGRTFKEIYSTPWKELLVD